MATGGGGRAPRPADYGMDWTSIAGAVGGLGGLAALILSVATALKYRSESRRSDSEEYRRQVKHLREDLDRRAEDLDERIEELAACRQRLEVVEGHVSAIELAIPLALVAPRLLRPLTGRMANVLDKLRCCLVIVSTSNGGRFLWVNEAFAQALGRQKADVLAAGWRSLIHPDDLPATDATESQAWTGDVGVVNRYRHADGSYRLLRWYAASYEGGATLAVAHVVESAEG